jgi:histidyl-tRNA synthetase
LVDLDHRSLKSQLRQADKSGARFALVIGPEELAKGTVQVRNLQEGSQVELPTSQAIKLLGEQAPR